jgi:hypothetical protein
MIANKIVPRELKYDFDSIAFLAFQTFELELFAVHRKRASYIYLCKEI